MHHIYCLIGKSASGKDTIYQRLLQDEALQLRRIVMYTTRPIREGEANGREYYFENIDDYEAAEKNGEIIEARTYPSFYGPWHYYTKNDGQIDLSQADYLTPSTLESYLGTRAFFDRQRALAKEGKNAEIMTPATMCAADDLSVVLPVYIDLDDGERLQRALSRERQQEHPKYEEMCRRFLADQADFTEEKIREAGITRRFVNDDLETCIRKIRDYILEIGRTDAKV